MTWLTENLHRQPPSCNLRSFSSPLSGGSTQPRTLMMSRSLSSPQHQDRGTQMGETMTRKSSHSPADTIRGGQLDSRLIYLLVWSDSILHFWIHTLKTWRNLCWNSSPLLLSSGAFAVPLWLVTAWEMMMSTVMWLWGGGQLHGFVLVCNDSIQSASACVLSEHTVCLPPSTAIFTQRMFGVVYVSLALYSLHSVAQPENVAIGPFPRELKWSSWAVRT